MVEQKKKTIPNMAVCNVSVDILSICLDSVERGEHETSQRDTFHNDTSTTLKQDGVST